MTTSEAIGPALLGGQTWWFGYQTPLKKVPPSVTFLFCLCCHDLGRSFYRMTHEKGIASHVKP